jgi:hypothetical protein
MEVARRNAALRTRRRRAVVVLVLGLACLGLGVTGAEAVPTVGAAVLADPDSSVLVGAQASDQLYTVTLPLGASCPGNTAEEGYRVYSFLVPAGTDPASVDFSLGTPSAGLGFVRTEGYFESGGANTASLGEVTGIPLNFQWSAGVGGFYPVTGDGGLIPNGSTASWVGGILCVDSPGAVQTYWAVDITFTVSASDPNGFVWTAGDTASNTTTTTVPTSTTSTTSTTVPTSTSTTSTTLRTLTTIATTGGGGVTGSGTQSDARTLAVTGVKAERLAVLGGLLLAIGAILVMSSMPGTDLRPLPWPDQR